MTSLDFIRNRYKTQSNLDFLPDAEWYQKPLNSLIEFKEDITKGHYYYDKNTDICLEFHYDPDTEYNYFITKRCSCDGTLVFLIELAEQIITKLYSLHSGYQPIVEEFDAKQHIMKFTMGDFVIVDEFKKEGSFGDKPWLKSRFTVMLPIKHELIKRNANSETKFLEALK